MTSDNTTPDPRHDVPRVSFGGGSDEPAETQDEDQRDLQEENAETSLDQPST